MGPTSTTGLINGFKNVAMGPTHHHSNIQCLLNYFKCQSFYKRGIFFKKKIGKLNIRRIAPTCWLVRGRICTNRSIDQQTDGGSGSRVSVSRKRYFVKYIQHAACLAFFTESSLYAHPIDFPYFPPTICYREKGLQ